MKESPLHSVLKIEDNEIKPITEWENLPHDPYSKYCTDRISHGAKPMSRADFNRLMESDGSATEAL